MNYLQHTTIYTSPNGTEYKHIKIQEYKVGHHKTTNKYFVDGKQARKHERWVCEQTIDENYGCSNYVFTEKKWTK